MPEAEHLKEITIYPPLTINWKWSRCRIYRLSYRKNTLLYKNLPVQSPTGGTPIGPGCTANGGAEPFIAGDDNSGASCCCNSGGRLFIIWFWMCGGIDWKMCCCALNGMLRKTCSGGNAKFGDEFATGWEAFGDCCGTSSDELPAVAFWTWLAVAVSKLAMAGGNDVMGCWPLPTATCTALS